MNKSKKIISTLGSYAGYKSMPMWSGNLLDPGKGVFGSGTENWIARDNNTIENDNGALKITYVDNNGGAYVTLSEVSDINKDLTVEKTYKIRIKIKINSGSCEIKVWNFSGTSVSNNNYEWKEITFTALYPISHWIGFNNLSTGEIIWIDQWEIRERRG